MKNFIFYTGLVTISVTTIFLILQKLDISTFGLINTAVLSVLFGWYKKLNYTQISNENKQLENEIIFLEQKVNKLDFENLELKKIEKDLKNHLKAYELTVDNLRNGFISEKIQNTETPVEKPKRVRKPKK